MKKRKSNPQIKILANLFRAIGQPARLRILTTIGEGEACVCHLEAVLGYRQAYISQHLMELRDADLVVARREGRYFFYRLADDSLLDLIRQAARLQGITEDQLAIRGAAVSLPECPCPNCDSEAGADLADRGYIQLNDVITES